jgi:hypothetical protein
LEQLELNLESFKENSARNQAGRNCAIWYSCFRWLTACSSGIQTSRPIRDFVMI